MGLPLTSRSMTDDSSPGRSDLSGLAAGDWPARAADTVEAVVDGIYDKVIRPLALVARGIVFGILVATMALVLSVLLAIAAVRLIDSYAFGHRVWASEALVGGIIALLGLLAWSMRRSRKTEAG